MVASDEVQAAVLMVHHDNRQGAFRGSSAIDGYVDTRLHCRTRRRARGSARCDQQEKQRDDEDGITWMAQLEVVDLGVGVNSLRPRPRDQALCRRHIARSCRRDQPHFQEHFAQAEPAPGTEPPPITPSFASRQMTPTRGDLSDLSVGLFTCTRPTSRRTPTYHLTFPVVISGNGSRSTSVWSLTSMVASTLATFPRSGISTCVPTASF